MAKIQKQHNDIMQRLVKLHFKAFFNENIRKAFIEEQCSKSEFWMSTEYDETILEYWKLANGKYMFKLQQNEGLDCGTDLKNTKPTHLDSFISSNKKRYMKDFVGEILDFGTNNVNYTDTDSLHIEEKHWDDLDKAGLLVDN